MSIEEVSIETPRDDEVLVHIKAAGICHSDISCRDQLFPAKLPQVFGREGAHKFIPALLSHYQNGDLPVDKWITRYAFKDINQAADDLLGGTTVKPVLLMGSA